MALLFMRTSYHSLLLHKSFSHLEGVRIISLQYDLAAFPTRGVDRLQLYYFMEFFKFRLRRRHGQRTPPSTQDKRITLWQLSERGGGAWICHCDTREDGSRTDKRHNG